MPITDISGTTRSLKRASLLVIEDLLYKLNFTMHWRIFYSDDHHGHIYEWRSKNLVNELKYGKEAEVDEMHAIQVEDGSIMILRCLKILLHKASLFSPFLIYCLTYLESWLPTGTKADLWSEPSWWSGAENSWARVEAGWRLGEGGGESAVPWSASLPPMDPWLTSVQEPLRRSAAVTQWTTFTWLCIWIQCTPTFFLWSELRKC